MNIREAIERVVGGGDLTDTEIAAVFGDIMQGQTTPAQIGGLLIGLRIKGETAEEIAGAARAMRAQAKPFTCPDPNTAVDTCGTGGDGSGHVNISTIAAIVAAAAGAKVAKHGNRALSSKSGSADVLEALGVAIDIERHRAEACLAELGIAFLFAPAYHGATRHAAAPRKELATRTIFNLLGPLTNPAGARNQIVGVYDGHWCEPVARALGHLGARHAVVVHGHGSIDEIAVDGPTQVAEFREGQAGIKSYSISPADFGLAEIAATGLRGGDAKTNAAIVQDVLAGAAGAVRTAVLMEAGVALWVSGQVANLVDGAAKAAVAIDSGAALTTLTRWAAMTRGEDGAKGA